MLPTLPFVPVLLLDGGANNFFAMGVVVSANLTHFQDHAPLTDWAVGLWPLSRRQMGELGDVI